MTWTINGTTIAQAPTQAPELLPAWAAIQDPQPALLVVRTRGGYVLVDPERADTPYLVDGDVATALRAAPRLFPHICGGGIWKLLRRLMSRR